MKGLEVIGSYLDEWNIVTITVRLILAVVCGGAIGLTRSVKRRGAGFKTHALVCLGSALVMMTGQYIYVDFGAISDIARLAAMAETAETAAAAISIQVLRNTIPGRRAVLARRWLRQHVSALSSDWQLQL